MWFRRDKRSEDKPLRRPSAPLESPASDQPFDAWAGGEVGRELSQGGVAPEPAEFPLGAERRDGGTFGWGETADPAETFAPAPGRSVHSGPGNILVVCTGNVCRSPYIERSLAARLEGTGIEVTSAGTGALVGEPIDPGSVALLDAAGVASGGFAARQLTPEMVEQADLILTATRDHRRAAVQLAPVGLRKTFALIDLVDVLDGVTAQDVAAAAGGNAVQRVVSLAECRRAVVHARVDGADIVDPFREDASVFAQMQGQIDAPVKRLAGLLRG